MSLLDDVIIVVTPNGYKAGELYAVIPVPTEGAEEITNGNFATDSDWTKGTNTTIEDGKAILPITSGGMQYISSNTANLISGNTYKIILTAERTSGTGRLAFTDSSANNISGTPLIDSGGDLVYYFIPTSNINGFGFKRHDVSGNYTWEIDNVSVKEYTSADMDVTRATAATRVDEDGLIADVLSGVPRIDYTGGGCPHILAEPERKNEVNYSEDFTDSSWVKTNVDVSNNTELAPNGTETATRAIISSTGTDLRTQCNVIESTNYTFTFYAKKGTSTDITYRVYDVSNGSNIVSPTNYFSQVGIDWQRVELNFTTPSGCTSVLVYLSSDSAVVGDIYLWGVQLEKSYATSYIPTSGSTVTRNQDIFTRDGIGSLINDSEGVLFAEIAALSDDSVSRKISLNSGTFANQITVSYGSGGSNIIQCIIYDGTNVVVNMSYSSTNITDFNKIAIKYISGNTSLWVNGVEVDTDNAAFSGLSLSALSFDNGSSTNFFYGKVKQLQVYNTALTDEQLLQLTGTSGTDFYESYAEMASALTYTIQ